MQKYDAIVIGAGNGGLTAACTVAKAGKKVLLIEQHNLPGGVASSFKRGRFEFETALHEYAGYGPDNHRGSSRIMLEDDLGLRIPWHPVPDVYRYITTGSDGKPLDVTLPVGEKAQIDKMEQLVPGCRKSVEDYFALAHEYMAASDYMSSSGGNVDAKYMQKHFPNFLRTATYPATKVLDALKMPKKAQDILTTYWSYVAVPDGGLNNLCAFEALVMQLTYTEYGAYIPDHTSNQLTTGLIERFRAFGGELWFNCRAEQILFDKSGHVSGVRTNRGEIETRHVISNINPNIVFGRMVPKELVSQHDIKLANARKFTARMFVAYMGLNKTAEELGLKDYSIFFADSADSAAEFASMKSIDSNKYFISLCYNIVNPNISPEGTCILSLTSMFTGDEAWGELEPRDYVRTKNRMAKNMIERFEKKLGVSVTPYIEEIEIATPWTFCRYAGVPQGGVYGYEMPMWDGILARSMNIKNDCHLPGLRFTGASVLVDGFNASQKTGCTMGKLTLKDMSEEDM